MIEPVITHTAPHEDWTTSTGVNCVGEGLDFRRELHAVRVAIRLQEDGCNFVTYPEAVVQRKVSIITRVITGGRDKSARTVLKGGRDDTNLGERRARAGQKKTRPSQSLIALLGEQCYSSA